MGGKHGDGKKRKVAEKERARRAPVPGPGKCALCGKVNPLTWDCRESPNGHIVLPEEDE